ncbi:MAG TPA: hypothetical protein VHB50_14425 [Bryobacteraceae bacterium]|nr:hypothetical protein [Bryobacteraceae bacterium]
MDLWSDNPVERLRAARMPDVVLDWPSRIGASAPMRPWPYGMPTSINPFVVFVGPSPGNSPPRHNPIHQAGMPYPLPTAGDAHPGLYVPDTRRYWHRVRNLGALLIRSHAAEISEPEAHALTGQLNLGIGHFGKAKAAPLEPDYCRWVPETLLGQLKPAIVILVGLASLLTRNQSRDSDPLSRLGIDWAAPEEEFPFAPYERAQYRYRMWTRRRSDGRKIRFVLWPQHPSRAPMTNDEIWLESGREFVRRIGL